MRWTSILSDKVEILLVARKPEISDDLMVTCGNLDKMLEFCRSTPTSPTVYPYEFTPWVAKEPPREQAVLSKDRTKNPKFGRWFEAIPER